MISNLAFLYLNVSMVVFIVSLVNFHTALKLSANRKYRQSKSMLLERAGSAKKAMMLSLLWPAAFGIVLHDTFKITKKES